MPDSSSPKSVYRPKRICLSLSLKKGNEHGKTVTAHVESKGNYISEGMFTMLEGVVCHLANRLIGPGERCRAKRPQFGSVGSKICR